MKNYFIYLVLLFFLIAIPVSSQDKLTKILQKELTRNYEVMSKLDVPVYYISLRVEKNINHNIQ